MTEDRRVRSSGLMGPLLADGVSLGLHVENQVTITHRKIVLKCSHVAEGDCSGMIIIAEMSFRLFAK